MPPAITEKVVVNPKHCEDALGLEVEVTGESETVAVCARVIGGVQGALVATMLKVVMLLIVEVPKESVPPLPIWAAPMGLPPDQS